MTSPSVACPLCGSGLLSVYMTGMGAASRLDKCAGCGLVFQNPVPDDLPGFYEGYRRQGGKRFFYGSEAFIKYFRLRRARMINRLSHPPGRVLDIGCGRGLMLAEPFLRAIGNLP